MWRDALQISDDKLLDYDEFEQSWLGFFKDMTLEDAEEFLRLILSKVEPQGINVTIQSVSRDNDEDNCSNHDSNRDVNRDRDTQPSYAPSQSITYT